MDKTKIEWADATWNPVTGCLHGCPYCYAARIAKRFGGHTSGKSIVDLNNPVTPLYILDEPLKNIRNDGKEVIAPLPYGFAPTFHRYRLDIPKRWKKSRTIFVGSMTDLFGFWMPEYWIKDVMAAAREAPQHRYLFLTKNYMRACDFKFEENWWIGRTYTHTTNSLAPGASKNENDYLCYGIAKSAAPYPAFAKHENTFLSVEPISGPVDDLGYYAHDHGYKWVIVGAETGNRSGKIIPQKEWIDRIVSDCDLRGIPVFMKDSLIPIVGAENMRRDFPWAT